MFDVNSLFATIWSLFKLKSEAMDLANTVPAQILTYIFNCLLDISTWVFHRHLQLNRSILNLASNTPSACQPAPPPFKLAETRELNSKRAGIHVSACLMGALWFELIASVVPVVVLPVTCLQCSLHTAARVIVTHE